MREQKKSLFIIGAGASKDFKQDFPTGEELIERLKNISMKYVEKTPYLEAYLKGCFMDFNSLELYNNKCIADIKDANGNLKYNQSYDPHYDGYIKSYIAKDTTKMQAKDTTKMQANITNTIDDLLNILLCNLINLYNPKSIDYFVGNDLEHYIKDEHIKQFESLGYKFKGKDIIKKDVEIDNSISSEDKKIILKDKLGEVASNKVKEILEEITYDTNDIKNGYFYKILCDEIGIDNIEIDNIKNIDIITFNYDLILEETIDYLLTINHTESRKEKLNNLKSRIQHVYGDIEKEIHFIRNKTPEELEEYRKLIEKADNIYFFGFAFDEQNLKNLGLTNGSPITKEEISLQTPRERKVFITNYGGLAKVEFRISRLFNVEFKVAREGVRSCIKGNQYFYISEKTITNALKGDFFFE